MKNILVTGADGIIGKQLVTHLANKYDDINFVFLNRNSTLQEIKEKILDLSFIFHLEEECNADDESVLQRVNVDFTYEMLLSLNEYKSKTPIVFLSSQKAFLKNCPYGNSKRRAEEFLTSFRDTNNVPVYIYRIPLILPNTYNENTQSVVSEFCYNIANSLEIDNSDPSELYRIVSVLDIVNEFENAYLYAPNVIDQSDYATVPKTYAIAKQELVSKIYNFEHCRKNNILPDLSARFDKQLYSFFMTCINADDLLYQPVSSTGDKILTTVFLNSKEQGSVTAMRISPGRKWETVCVANTIKKFLLVNGNVTFKLTRLNTNDSAVHYISHDNCKAVDLPPGYQCVLENTGTEDAILVGWESN